MTIIQLRSAAVTLLFMCSLLLFTSVVFVHAQTDLQVEYVQEKLQEEGLVAHIPESEQLSIIKEILSDGIYEGIESSDTETLVAYAKEAFLPAPDEYDADALLGGDMCAQYYDFGSVEVLLETALAGTVSGAPIAFSGTITNNNPYPITQGALYVKVFFFAEDTDDVQGPQVVDQGFVEEDIIIAPGATVPIELTWNVPAAAISGDYMIATFFTEAKRFNLSGLSFSDDILGTTVGFTVAGESTDGVVFDRDGVSVDGDQYFFIAFPPQVPERDPVTVQARLVNTTDEAQVVPVTWQVFAWDAQREENLIEEITKTVRIAPQSTALAEHVITDTDHPVYLVEATAQFEDLRSVINIRFVREGISSPRLNMVGLSSYPTNGQTEIFACFHNTAEDLIENGSLKMTLRNSLGEMLYEKEFTGGFISDVYALGDALGNIGDQDYLVLDAVLSNGGEVVDSVSMTYDCKEINPALCGVSIVSWNDILSQNIGVIIGFFALLALVVVLYLIYKQLFKEKSQHI